VERRRRGEKRNGNKKTSCQKVKRQVGRKLRGGRAKGGVGGRRKGKEGNMWERGLHERSGDRGKE